MVTLKSCEIIDELKKLGVHTPAEIIELLSEYSDYYFDTIVSPKSD